MDRQCALCLVPIRCLYNTVLAHEFVDQLNDVDTSEIAPLKNPLEKTAKTRKDIVTAKNLKKEMLEVAPSANEDYFLVPRVVE